MGSFQQNLSIDIDEAVKNITIGDGYVILKGLFKKEDIDHARETILYLISKQGVKATHFQVLQIVSFIYINAIYDGKK